MDLSKVKWVVIIAIVVGGGWLLTSGGVNWAYNKATSGTPGQDASADARNEALLSRYGGFLLATFRYERAKDFYTAAITNFPGGKNAYYNMYQLARCEDKLGNYQAEVDILTRLYEVEAVQYDTRVANQNKLKLRIEKLVEVHELPDPLGVQ